MLAPMKNGEGLLSSKFTMYLFMTVVATVAENTVATGSIAVACVTRFMIQLLQTQNHRSALTYWLITVWAGFTYCYRTVLRI